MTVYKTVAVAAEPYRQNLVRYVGVAPTALTFPT